jgi:hypothetical protein
MLLTTDFSASCSCSVESTCSDPVHKPQTGFGPLPCHRVTLLEPLCTRLSDGGKRLGIDLNTPSKMSSLPQNLCKVPTLTSQPCLRGGTVRSSCIKTIFWVCPTGPHLCRGCRPK